MSTLKVSAISTDKEPMSHDKQIEAIEGLIRAARGAEAQERLIAWHKEGVKPTYSLRVATLATRANLPELALKILHPIVRPSAKFVRTPAPEDLAQYAFALLRIGACIEAGRLLAGLPQDKVPEVLLYRAMILIKEWNYLEALPLLKAYIRTPSLTQYQRLGGKVNLASCQIFEDQLPEAKMLLAEVLEEASSLRLDLMYAVGLRLLGNLEMRRKNWDSALGCFENAEKILSPHGGLEHYFARKWKALTLFRQSPEKKKNLLLVRELRTAATEWRHWESQRDIDYHIAIETRDEHLAWTLYFGTPFPEFRKRILKEFKIAAVPPKFLWELGTPSPARDLIELGEQQKTKKGDFLKSGKSMHRLYTTLTSDFYRPFSVAALFEKLYPNDYYSPESSEGRVHLVVRRLRNWFRENDLPVIIDQSDGAYALKAEESCSIVISPPTDGESEDDSRLNLIREKLGDVFSRKDAEELLRIERSATAIVIQKGITNGILEKTGSGPITRYRFKAAGLQKTAA